MIQQMNVSNVSNIKKLESNHQVREVQKLAI
jgi:hypothetical protein